MIKYFKSVLIAAAFCLTLQNFNLSFGQIVSIAAILAVFFSIFVDIYEELVKSNKEK